MSRKIEWPAKQSESAFLAQVLELAKLLGWKSFHVRPGMNRRGHWSTPIQGDGVGFPDLVLARYREKDEARAGRIIAAELKSEDGKESLEQEAWLTLLEWCGVESYLWRPSDLPEIARVLN
jgi:hypothetical protein